MPLDNTGVARNTIYFRAPAPKAYPAWERSRKRQLNCYTSHSPEQTVLYRIIYHLVDSEHFDLGALQERDVQAGHEILDGSGHIVQAVYRVEVVPDDLSSEYSLQVARYSFNLAQTGLNETYSHAFTLPGRIGADGDVFGQITNETFACGTVINWVEVVNVKPTPVVATVTFRSASGATLGSAMDTIPGHGQLHYYAGSVLPAGQIGTVQVSSTVLESIIAESLAYETGDLLAEAKELLEPALESHSRTDDQRLLVRTLLFRSSSSMRF